MDADGGALAHAGASAARPRRVPWVRSSSWRVAWRAVLVAPPEREVAGRAPSWVPSWSEAIILPMLDFHALSASLVLAISALPAGSAANGAGAPARVDPRVREEGDVASADQDDAVDRTVVTARKREEQAADLPQSLTVVDREAIEKGGLQTVRDASLRVPNVLVTEFSSRRLSFPFVRGVGSGLGDPAVITYVDGVPQYGTGGTNLPLLDVERVEFLRGPQGTLYGRNALGGLIHVVTRRPAAELEAGLHYGFGSDDLRELGFHVSGPISADSGFSFSGLGLERDGFTKNDFTGNDVDFRDGLFGRAQWLTALGERSELRVTLFAESAEDGGFVLSDLQGLRQRPHRISQDFEGVTERDVVSPTVTFTRLGDEVDVTSITAFQTWDVLETSDFDFSPLDGVRRRTEEEQTYFSQELRLSSSEGAGHRLAGRDLRWLAGVNAFLSDSERLARNEFRPALFPPPTDGIDTTRGDFDDFGVGLFGQVTLQATERLELTGGVRVEVESKEAERGHTFATGGFVVLDEESDFDETYEQVLPHVGVGYRLRDDLLGYATVSRGFKAGGFNLNAPAGQIPFRPERSWTYEAGLKKSWDDEAVLLGASLFYVDWDSMQLSLFDALAGGYVDNAGESESVGVELQLEAQLAEGLELFAGLGLVNTEFDEYVDPYGVDVSGNELPFAPDTTLGLGLQYTHPLGEESSWFVAGELGDVGDFFYDAQNREREGYTLVHARTGVRFDRWGLDLWVRNAFDEEYVPVAFQPNPGDPTVFVGESGAPRTIGATLSVGI